MLLLGLRAACYVLPAACLIVLPIVYVLRAASYVLRATCYLLRAVCYLCTSAIQIESSSGLTRSTQLNLVHRVHDHLIQYVSLSGHLQRHYQCESPLLVANVAHHGQVVSPPLD